MNLAQIKQNQPVKILREDRDVYEWWSIKSSTICLDLETDGLESDCKVIGIGICKVTDGEPYDGVYLPWSLSTRVFLTQHLFPEVRTMIMHNMKFDLKVLKRLDFEVDHIVCLDTFLWAYWKNPDQYLGLKDLVNKNLNVQMKKFSSLIGTGKKKKEITEIDEQELAQYCIQDTLQTGFLASKFNVDLDKDFLIDLEHRVAHALINAELRGVKIDVNFLRYFQKQIDQKLLIMKEQLKTEFGGININSGKQLGDYLFDESRIKYSSKKNTNGTFKTDAKTLSKYQDQNESIKILLDYKLLLKLKNTYIDNILQMIDEDGILHAEFNQGVTSTGRLSSSNPNLQNIPVRTDEGKELRKCFISRFENGYILSADYSQIELRILAHLSQDKVMIHAFKNNQDVHKATASSVFNIPIEEVTDKQRYMCKTLNFALLYQQGPHATAAQLDITVEEAEKFIDSYFSKLTQVLIFIDKIKALTRRKGFTETLFGRRRYYYNLKSNCNGKRNADLRAAVNMPIQGTSADITKMAISNVEDFLKDYKSKVLFTVHDELVVDVHPDEINIVKDKIKDIMEMNQPFSVPIIVNVKYGRSWYECK